jgi:hypothetical protein
VPLTKAELVQRCKARGIFLHPTMHQGFPYLFEPKSLTSIAIPDCSDTDTLPPLTVEAVCQAFGLNREDFGLDADPDLN